MLGVWQYLQGELAGLDGFEEVSLLQKARRQVAVQFAKTLSHPRLHLLLDGLQTQGHSVTMQACNKYLLASFAVLAPFHDLTQSQRERSCSCQGTQSAHMPAYQLGRPKYAHITLVDLTIFGVQTGYMRHL